MLGRPLFQCHACHRQTSLTAGTLFNGTKLPLSTCFLAIYLISQAKTGLSALQLKRQIGVSFPTAWLMHQKIMKAMVKREAQRRLSWMGGYLTPARFTVCAAAVVRSAQAAISRNDGSGQGSPCLRDTRPKSGLRIAAAD